MTKICYSFLLMRVLSTSTMMPEVMAMFKAS